MKTNTFSFILFLFTFSIAGAAAATPVHPPGLPVGQTFLHPKSFTDTPEVFLPNSITAKYAVRDMAISPDGKEMFFTMMSPRNMIMCIVYCKKEKEKWSDPVMAPFSGQFSDLEPAFTPDGKKLFFCSNRPVTTGGKLKDFDIWYVPKEGKGWGQPVNLGTIVNTSADEYYPSVASNGNIYFTAAYKDAKGKEDIYCSEWKNGAYQQPVSLPDAVNSKVYEFNAWISPDENLLLYTSQGREDELGGGDLYISRKDATGTWQQAVHLPAPVNSTRLDYCPFVSFDKTSFYFTSDRFNIKRQYDEPLTLPRLLSILDQPMNGKSNIYKLDARTVTGLVY